MQFNSDLWAISESDKESYKRTFNAIVPKGLEAITEQAAREVFSKSGLGTGVINAVLYVNITL